MDDLTPLVVVLIDQLLKGQFAKIAIPREYLKAALDKSLYFEWNDENLQVGISEAVASESSG